MTVILELGDEIEAIARAQAEARGISVEEYLRDLLATTVPHAERPADRKAYARAIMGKFAFLGPSQLMANKEAEKALEERRWTSK